MYKEKVARQEIGVLTAPGKIPYVQKMAPPARPEEPNAAYERVPISYSSLDSVGHGAWNSDKTVCVISNCADVFFFRLILACILEILVYNCVHAAW